MRVLAGIWMVWLLAALPAMAAITRTDIRFSEQTEEISFTSATPLELRKHFTLSNPPRLVIDLARLSHGKGAGLSPQYNGQRIADIRFGQFSADTSRLVIDLRDAVTSYQLTNEGRVLRVTLSDGAPTRNPPPLSAAADTGTATRQQATDFPLPVDKPALQAKEAKKPVIVIDAGHGGKDSGAIGKRGTIEKEVTLDYARALRKALLKTGRYRVVMTRDGDNYLFLNERVQVARQQQGDAFLSLHADSNPRGDAKGLSVYTLSEKASDAEAAALAAQENKADIIGGLDLSVEDASVANILIDLAQRETNNKSSHLAETIIASIDSKIPLITNPHRFAGFRVLKAPDIPSVLIEVGFLSNPEDENRVRSREYQDRVIRSVIRALDRFFGLE